MSEYEALANRCNNLYRSLVDLSQDCAEAGFVTTEKAAHLIDAMGLLKSLRNNIEQTLETITIPAKAKP